MIMGVLVSHTQHTQILFVITPTTIWVAHSLELQLTLLGSIAGIELNIEVALQ